MTPSAGFSSIADEVADLRTQVRDFQYLTQDLRAKNDWLTRLVYGSKQERRPTPQDPGIAQESFLTAPVIAVAIDPVAAAAVIAADEALALQTAEQIKEAARVVRNAKKGRGPDGKKKAINGGGRKPVNRSLREVISVITAPESERVAADGTPFVLLGFEVSEREQYIDAELVRQIVKREQWGLSDTREVAYVATLPPTIVPKGKYADTVIAEAMCRKYVLGLPFTRMLADFKAMGSDLSDSQLSDLAGRFATFMSPVALAIRTQVLAHGFVHVDETPLPTLDGKRTLWAWVGGNQAFFHIGGRGGKELRAVLGLPPMASEKTEIDLEPHATVGWMCSHLMADAYQPYDTVTDAAAIIRLCCWAHGRRNFLPAERDKDPVAIDLLNRIHELYHVEKRAREAVAGKEPSIVTGLRATITNVDAIHAEYHQRRQRESLTILAGIHAACSDALTRYPDEKNAMRQALTYLLSRWETFTGYTARGDLPIDNNQAERAIRPIVIGRKNWYFIGSEDATDWAATNFTIFESCRLAKVNPRAWLRYVIARMHAGDTDYAAMTPTNCIGKFPAMV